MKVSPVKKPIVPLYPDKYSVDLNHMLLYYRPKRWLYRPVVGTTLAAVVSLGLSACGSYITTGAPIATQIPAQITDIPLFEHGEGIGVIGCVSVTAPVFLSEEEAYAIISEALETAGLICKRPGDSFDNAIIPMTDPDNIENPLIRRQKGSITFDAKINIDEQHQFNIEFVSKDDVIQWANPNSQIHSTVSAYDMHGAALTLNSNSDNIAVFYDPVVPNRVDTLITEEESGLPDEQRQALWEQRFEAANEAAGSQCREALREQVLDFIAWLKATDIV